MSFDAHHELLSPSGARINVRWRQAVGVPRAVVHVSHGLWEHSGRYAEFADLLAARGFHIHAHDHRGHGQTRAADALPGHFGGGAAVGKLLADMDTVRDFIGQGYPDLPVILFGRATGGLIALNYALRYPGRVAALAWEDPPTLRIGSGKRAMLAWERLRLGSDIPSRAMTEAAPPGVPTSVGTWHAIAAMQDRLARRQAGAPASGHIPILILCDSASHQDAGTLAGRLRKIGVADVTLRQIAGSGPGEGGVATFGDWAQSMVD